MTPRPCKVCDCSRHKYFGVAVDSLGELKRKGSEKLDFKTDSSVSVVLDDDGTIVEDETYFLCLPPNTKFMLLCTNEVWTPHRRFDGGTAWLRSETVEMETDAVDSGMDIGAEPWHMVADKLKENLANIILMSEADLQSLVDIPNEELSSALGFNLQKTQDLQDTLQRVLDRREEERQSKELLELYLKAENKENGQALQQTDGKGLDEADGEGASGFSSRSLIVLKGRTSPETRLSNKELQMVVKGDVKVLMDDLGWDRERTISLVQACEGELNKRLQQVQALNSLSSHSQQCTKGTQAKQHK